MLAGATAAVAAVLTEGRLGPRDPRTSDPTSWWGILPPVPPTGTAKGVLAAASALALLALCGCWLVLVRRALTGRAGPRAAVAAALAWAAPFALGPPLFSRDAYAYAAQGELVRRGLDPATHGVAALTGPLGATFRDAVDPRWRDTHSPYGGGAVAVEKLAAVIAHATGGGPTVALAVLRVVAVLSVVVLAMCAPRLLPTDDDEPARPRPAAAPAGPREGRDRQVAVVLALVVANPVTTVHLIGGMHLDALVTAALAAALLAERRARTGREGGRRWPAALAGGPVAATALATFAGTVKATAFLGLGWLVVAHARDARARAATGAAPGAPASRARWAQAAAIAFGVLADAAVAVLVLLLSMLASGFGPSWLRALKTSGALTTGVAPVSLLANLLAIPARLAGWQVSTGSGSALLGACRALGLAAAAVVVALLLWRAWRRADPADLTAGRPAAAGGLDGLRVRGVGGFAVALGSPVIYPWYLGPALPMLGLLVAAWLPAGAPAAAVGTAPGDDPTRRRRRVTAAATVACSVWLCAATMSPLGPTWHLLAS